MLKVHIVKINAYPIGTSTMEMVHVFCPSCERKHVFYRNTNEHLIGNSPLVCRGCLVALPAVNLLLDPQTIGALKRIRYYRSKDTIY